MKRIKLAAILSLAALASLVLTPLQAEEEPQIVARQMAIAHGGQGAHYEELEGIAFDFVVRVDGTEMVRRRHVWDLANGRAAVSASPHEGTTVSVVFTDIENGVAEVLINGSPAAEAMQESFRDSGFQWYINDTYWLVAPLKVFDPGTARSEADVKQFQGEPVESFKLSFAQVGLTPGDVYTFYCDPETYLMEGWSFVLEGGREGTFVWADNHKLGEDIILSMRKHTPDGETEIVYENVSYGPVGMKELAHVDVTGEPADLGKKPEKMEETTE